ncbi:hypothetical protein, partial [Aneurinibacillus migulanus]|uniref:hypothetical protein n=1 Tax=Aneurinibacillus migulanus TaxID=47500 RepID=UPI003D20DCC3
GGYPLWIVWDNQHPWKIIYKFTSYHLQCRHYSNILNRELYTFNLIHRQMFMVEGKKRRKGGRRERSEEDTLAFLLPDRIPNRLLPTTPPVKISSVIYIV